MADWERDFTTEVEQGEDAALALYQNNRDDDDNFSNLRYWCDEAGYDQTIGCPHERGAFSTHAVEAHAARGITIPYTFFCFDCGHVQEVPAEVAKGNNFRDIACSSPVLLGGIDADGNFHEPEPLNLSPARPDYVTQDGTEVWIVRAGGKGPKARFVDAEGNQVGDTQPHLAGATVAARFYGWTDPTNPEWFEEAARRDVLQWDGRKLVTSAHGEASRGA